MIMKRSLFAISLLFLIAASASANTCSKSDIDHYLKSGFSHAQVVQLCGMKSAATPVVMPAKDVRPLATSPYAANTNDQIFFKSAIKAHKVEIAADKLVYFNNECMVFGLEDMTGEKDSLCRDVKTIINYAGLSIIQTQKEIPLLQKSHLIMRGTISRELLQVESIPKRHKKAFFEDFATAPKTIDIPFRKGFDPKDIAGRLMAYSR
jgi:hypothetical protein